MPDTPPEEAASSPVLVSIEQASTLLGIPYITVYKLVRKGDIEARRIGRRHWVVLAALHEYVKNLPPSAESA